MKGKHFVVFAYGSEFSHMVNAPEVVIIAGNDYLSVYTSYRSYADSKPIEYSKIQDEMATIVDGGGILVLKNTQDYGLTLSWAGISKSNPSDMIEHIDNHIINIDKDLETLIGHKINLNDADLPSQLHTEIYAPVWQKGSEVKIIQECISDANVILALVKRCSDASDIRVRLRNEEIPMEFDVEW
tara:strand:- start:1029 stop:1583 length:555 start_codon:yes stop_codon:yes gene_type:complete